MRTFLRIVISIIGLLVALIGILWFLQGVNVLPGSMMSGVIQWAVYGVIAFIVGILLLVWANRSCALTAHRGCQAV